MWKGQKARILVLLATVLMGTTAFAGCFGAPPEEPVNLAPFATATADQELVTAGTDVTFMGTGTDVDGSVSAYRWNFGDGTNGTGANATHAYTHHGRFYVTLNVTDNGGATYDTIVTGSPIRVDVLPNFPDTTPDDQPLAQLALWSPTTVIRPNTEVSWSGATSLGSWNAQAAAPGTLETYEMDFGDMTATVSHTQAELDAGTWDGNFTHTYAASGTHAAMLTVTTTSGKSDTTIWTVIVIPAAPTAGGVKNPDTIIIETIGSPETLDPAIAYDSASGEVIEAVYETLLYYDGPRPDVFVPVLITEIPTIANGGITNGNMTYTFHIKPNVKFHSGKVLTAEDAAYSFKRVMTIDDPGSASWIFTQVMNVSGVVATDASTLTITLERPYGAFLSSLAYTVGSIVNKDFVEAHGGTVAGQKNDYMARHTDGTGAFKLNSWVSGQQVALDKFADYHDVAKAAKTDHVIIKYVNEYSTRLIELRSGAADIIYVPSPERPGMVALAANPDEKIAISTGVSTWAVFMGTFNWNINTTSEAQALIGSVPSPDNVPSDFFADLNMRKAFSYAFDYQQYLTDVNKGYGKRLVGVIPSGMYGYDATLTPPPFDMTQAQAAYDASDWVAANGADHGFNLTVGYNCGNTAREGAALILKDGVESLGNNININVKCWEWPTYLGLTLHTGSGDPGPVGVYFIGWGPDYADPDDYVVPFARTGGTYPAYSGYSNTSLDAMIDQAGQMPNGQDRLDLYRDIQEALLGDFSMIWISEATNFHASKTWVKGWYFNPMFGNADDTGRLAALYKE
jgi:peptide/nickel transport system substrate-binding protein